jgi:hypothetical protein
VHLAYKRAEKQEGEKKEPSLMKGNCTTVHRQLRPLIIEQQLLNRDRGCGAEERDVNCR